MPAAIGRTAVATAEAGTRAAAVNARGTLIRLALAGMDGAGAGADSGVACPAAAASAAIPSQTSFGPGPAAVANTGSDVTTMAQATIALMICRKMLLVRNTKEGEEANSSLATASSPLQFEF
jgi:hypothetical protein